MNLDALRDVPYFLDSWYALVSKRPNGTLVVDGATQESFTVADMEQMSGKIYAYLRQQGVGAEDFAMFCLPRGASFVAAMLGVWKAGAAFTAVEDDYAPDRIAYIREDVGCKIFIDKALFDQIQATVAYEKGYCEADDHDAAFAVYTSGTTGFPKGIVHEYGNIGLNSISGRVGGGRRLTAEDRYAVISTSCCALSRRTFMRARRRRASRLAKSSSRTSPLATTRARMRSTTSPLSRGWEPPPPSLAPRAAASPPS